MAADLKSTVAAAAVAGCVADAVTFPLDTAKVRLQVQGVRPALLALPRSSVVNLRVPQPQPQYQGMLGTISTIAREEGPRALYNGLTAGLKRQMCLASIRLGLYEPTKQFYQEMFDYGFPSKTPSNDIHIGCRMLAGMTTGATAVLLAHPTDIVTVRFQAAARGAGHQYSSIFGAYRKITRHEGVPGLWRGMFPNVMTKALITVAEIVCYDVAKDTFLMYKLLDEGVPLHFGSAVIAGFCATVVASPVDVVKTRCMNSPPGEYKNAIDCAMRLINHDGVCAFYKGFIPSVFKFMSWNIVMWMTYEHVKTTMLNFSIEEDDNTSPVVA